MAKVASLHSKAVILATAVYTPFTIFYDSKTSKILSFAAYIVYKSKDASY